MKNQRIYISKFLIVGGLISLTLLGGCAGTKPALQGKLDPRLGSAVHANISAQAVAPTPEQKANTYIPADPARAALVRKKYKENKVDEPQQSSPSAAVSGN